MKKLKSNKKLLCQFVRFNKYVVIYLCTYYEGRKLTVLKAICFINRGSPLIFSPSWKFGRIRGKLNLRLGVLSFTYIHNNILKTNNFQRFFRFFHHLYIRPLTARLKVYLMVIPMMLSSSSRSHSNLIHFIFYQSVLNSGCYLFHSLLLQDVYIFISCFV